MKYRGNYYICPEYWCALTQEPLTEDDIKAGKCGGKLFNPLKSASENKGAYILHRKVD